jgi:ATP-binding cassette subfamily F protein uup
MLSAPGLSLYAKVSILLRPMLLTGRNLSKWFGPRVLFQGITLGFAPGERVGLIGANGSGKSTLLRIFAGIEQPDEGELILRRALRVGYVPQEESFDEGLSCLDAVAGAIDPHVDEHERHARAGRVLERAGFADEHQLAEKLSGGWKKRLSIVKQIAREPELLLLDEPTNHLDLEGIYWLEDLIDQADFATLIVSHDRRFLEQVSRRIIEIGTIYPEGFLSHIGTYSDFVEKRSEFLIAQKSREQALASTVKREIEWLRRGAKARTTKAKGRIERAGEMMADLADLRSRNAEQRSAEIDFNATRRQTRKLIQLKSVEKSMGGRKLFDGLSLVLSPKDTLGLLGPNGSGKSTLIGLLTGRLDADQGEIVRADNLKVVVFDQHREQLDQKQTLRRALSPGGDNLVVNGQAMHVSGWARKFLFRNEQLDMPLSDLSGGEQARVLLARLMQVPADVLILDEPTNDLDIPTLDVLEESLEDFAGAVVLVTHDRYLLDRLSTSILSLDGRGGHRAFASLEQWERAKYEADRKEAERQRAERQRAARQETSTDRASASASDATMTQTPARKKLTWNEQRELEKMEETIHAAETKLAELQAATADPVLSTDYVKANAAYEAAAKQQAEVDRLYARWEELNSRA